ncbi:MAG: glycosyltransferase [Hyphomicrobiaceae bacterium]|nr:glycosyltransferase [Hyphomicrobiaceae bacterium]
MIETVSTRRHILTVNLEDYFQVGPLSAAIPRRHWPRFESRVEQNTEATLDLLDQYGHKATFFTVGWIADKLPHVVREVVRRGHEVASKGYYHRALRQMSREEFEADALQSRIALERAAEREVFGYRIARGWFSRRDLWALPALERAGYRYDSSLRKLGFSLPSGAASPAADRRSPTGLVELPLASWRLAGFDLPISGGNYLRQLPADFMRRRFAETSARSLDPLVFYFHTWELDPEQPRISGLHWSSRMRQYRNLEDMGERVRTFLENYQFGPASTHLGLTAAPVSHPPRVVEEPVQAPAAASAADLLPVTVIVPCYNEEQSLAYLARALDQFVAETADRYQLSFVFVDDGSKDRTLAGLQQQFGSRANCQIVQHPQNRGIAAACLTGFAAARDEIVCVIDADCTFDPSSLATMIPLLTDDVALVTASPYHRDGGVMNVPAWRLVLSRGASRLYSYVLTNKLASYTACFRVYRRSAVADMQLEHSGFTGIAEILVRLDQAGARIVESPAVLEARVLGVSKMKVARTIMEHSRLIGRLAILRKLPSGDVTATGR